jgi:hypothetical protein
VIRSVIGELVILAGVGGGLNATEKACCVQLARLGLEQKQNSYEKASMMVAGGGWRWLTMLWGC